MNARHFFTVLSALFISAISCFPQDSGQFFAGIDYPTGINPYQAEVGDFNNDGKPDIVAGGYSCGGNCAAVQVYLSNGDGTFQGVGTVVSTLNAVWGITVGDFNKDGNLDVVAYGNSANGESIVLLLGDGQGDFSVSATYTLVGTSGNQLPDLITSDFNGDGKPDVAIYLICGTAQPSCTQGHDVVEVFLSNGDGTFSAPGVYDAGLTGDQGAIVAASFTGHAWPDLAVTASGYPQSSLAILIGNGDGTFQATPILSGLPFSNADWMAGADFNLDGNADLAIGGSSAVQVLFGNGNGTFQAPTSYQAPSGFLLATDVNGDGAPDIISTVGGNGYSNGYLGILLNNGSGGFTVSPNYWFGGWGTATAVAADFNGDGKVDVAATSTISENNYQSERELAADGTLTVFLGNGNGTLQAAVQPTLSTQLQWLVMADVNGDGIPDIVGANAGGDGEIVIELGLGNGTYGPATIYGGNEAIQVFGEPAVADINGDGKPDVVVAGGDPSTGLPVVAVYLGNGDGTLQAPTKYSIGGSNLGPPAIGNFAGNGKPGVAVIHSVNGQNYLGVGILLGNGDGTLQPEIIAPATELSGYGRLAVGDFNNDGKTDVAALGTLVAFPESYTGVSVFTSNGDGTLTQQADPYTNPDYDPLIVCNSGNICIPLQSYPTYGTFYLYYAEEGMGDIAVADFNGDGNLDLVGVSTCELNDRWCLNGQTVIYYGLGNGTFAVGVAPQQPLGDANFIGVTAQDVNGDGKADIVATTLTGVGVYLYPFSSNGAVYAGPSQSYPHRSSVSGLNGDGAADIAITNGNQFTTMLNRGGAASLATAASVASSANPSIYGQLLTFTASVTSSSGVPTGSVTFYDSATSLGSVTLQNGQGSIGPSTLIAGTHSITAQYSPTGNFLASTSPVLSQVVNLGTTTNMVGSNIEPAVIGQSVTYTAVVSNAYGAAITGSVTLKDGAKTLGTFTLSAGQVSYTTSYATDGKHTITATYSGDANDQGSTGSWTQYVETLPVGSTMKVTTSGSPSTVDQSLTFTATVSSTYGSIPNGETVTFYDGTMQIGTGTTAGGAATFSTAALTVKTHTIKATYAGDATFKPSSGTVQQVVEDYATNTSLSANPTPSNFGQAVVLTAVVTTAGSMTPTGKVTFYNDNSSLGTGTLDSTGTTTLTMAKLPVGTDSLSAIYDGDSLNAKSTSSVLDQTVDQAQITITVMSSPNPSTSGKSVKFTATLSSNGSLPNGQIVTFSYNGSTVGTGTISAKGIATCSTTTLPAGSDEVTATYGGSADYSSASGSVSQTVN
jgi:hypothetical protein